MVVTDRFVFLHLHKSGGSFVLDCLRRFIPSARTVGFHLPRHRIPTEHASLPILGFVRNPWSYYVSWYCFQAQRPTPNALFRIVSEGGRLGFEATVRNLLDLGAGSPLLDEVLAALPTDYGGSGIQLPRYALEPLRDSGLGFYAHVYSYFYGAPSPGLTIERAENLRARLLDFLVRVDEPISQTLRAFVRDAPRRNTSAHGPYTDYYSDELRERVARQDQLVITRHRYAFGD
jgi:hypothetical protein